MFPTLKVSAIIQRTSLNITGLAHLLNSHSTSVSDLSRGLRKLFILSLMERKMNAHNRLGRGLLTRPLGGQTKRAAVDACVFPVCSIVKVS